LKTPIWGSSPGHQLARVLAPLPRGVAVFVVAAVNVVVVRAVGPGLRVELSIVRHVRGDMSPRSYANRRSKALSSQSAVVSGAEVKRHDAGRTSSSVFGDPMQWGWGGSLHAVGTTTAMADDGGSDCCLSVISFLYLSLK
jgi:hypothetical protein